ncbi:MAG TPA: peptidylprolyl isomerase [Chitinophagaceae bacterium]
MKKSWLPVICFLLAISPAFSQTLFTYGNHSVSAAEFLRAYNKNNLQAAPNKGTAMRDYLELYINSRLKIREAYERGYDTLPQLKSEVENLRNQIIESYMSDPETMNKLVKEAMERSKKDIHAGHIFISVTNNDTVAAYARAQAAFARLKKGEDFMKVAQEVSQDPAVKTNKGDIGWITVFTLPYFFENKIYSLPVGGYSGIVRSKAGYHLFKNFGERKALGKMKARQILLAYPPDPDEATKKAIAKKADSLYKRLLAGEDFGKLATAYSNDYLTAVTGGTMPDFGVGQYDPVFESNVWALTKNGAVTKPFATSHGYHIVKRISVTPVFIDAANKLNDQELRQKINQDQRWKASREVVFEKVIKQAGFEVAGYKPADLWAYTDSLLDKRPLGSGASITPETRIFKIGDTAARASDWTIFAQAFRMKQDGSGRRPYEEVMNDYVHSVVFQYYRDHLELYNDEFRYQMNEFKDGNLFFEIMQKEIWNRAHSDSAELLALYETNKSKYNWNKSADAVVFFCADPAVAKALYEKLRKKPLSWREEVELVGDKVVADSARYEWQQIPNKSKMIPVSGMITEPIVNAVDNTVSFAYVIKTYSQTMPRTYSEAKGLVVNDYQSLLEAQWVKKLRQKYPVKVDEQVFNSIAK